MALAPYDRKLAYRLTALREASAAAAVRYAAPQPVAWQRWGGAVAVLALAVLACAWQDGWSWSWLATGAGELQARVGPLPFLIAAAAAVGWCGRGPSVLVAVACLVLIEPPWDDNFLADLAAPRVVALAIAVLLPVVVGPYRLMRCRRRSSDSAASLSTSSGSPAARRSSSQA
jgi:hypothetical protein